MQPSDLVLLFKNIYVYKTTYELWQHIFIMLHLLFLLLLWATPARSWCSCNNNEAGSFASLLDLSVSPTVRIGSNLLDRHPMIFSQETAPQALVAYLAHAYANGQAVAASQMLSRCMRYTRGGFDLMVTTGFMIAARNGSRLTWLRIKLDLYAACRNSADSGVFRTTHADIHVLPVDLRELDSNADPTGSLVDTAQSTCMPRVTDPESSTQVWLDQTYNTADIRNGPVWWISHRTYRDLLVRMLVCGPSPTDEIEGIFFARNTDRPYVQVCTFQEAIWCAADAMLVNQPAPSRVNTLDGLRGPGLLADNTTVYTRAIHYSRPAPAGSRIVYFSVLDIIADGKTRQVATVLFTEENETVADVFFGMDLEVVSMQDRVSEGGQSMDCDRQLDVISQHACDPLVFNDNSVTFGVAPSDSPLLIGVSGGMPCQPAVTAACPAVILPSPVFRGSTIAGIVIGAIIWTLFGAWAIASIIECKATSRRKNTIGERKKFTSDELQLSTPKPTAKKPTAVSASAGLSRRPTHHQVVKKTNESKQQQAAPPQDSHEFKQFLSELGVSIRKL